VGGAHPTGARGPGSSGGREGPGRARGMEDGEGMADRPRPGVGTREGLRAGLGVRGRDRPQRPALTEVVSRRGRRRGRRLALGARRPLARRGEWRRPREWGRAARHQPVGPVEERGRGRGRHTRVAAAGLCLAGHDEAPRHKRHQGAGPGECPPYPGRGSHASGRIGKKDGGGRRLRPSETLSWPRVVSKHRFHQCAFMSPHGFARRPEDTP
jgi:hypothetical protein